MTEVVTKERGILFNGEMVRGILGDRKTHTRRPMKYIPDLGWPEDWCDNVRLAECILHVNVASYSPFGAPGDRLWVRETWAIKGCGRRVPLDDETWAEGWPIDRLQYVATDEAPNDGVDGGGYWWNKRPSIHMPRWASRITLEVQRVWVERVQDISEEDMIAEGFDRDIDGMKTVWDAIYAAKGLGWEANPWVWCCEFKRVEPSE